MNQPAKSASANAASRPSGHARDLMDGIYRRQRFIYDLTRKYYLLGRDRLIERLDPPDGGRVLELGCGTGRNLVLAARRYPGARFYGIDLSGEMLKSAAVSVSRAGLEDRVALAAGDATDFDSMRLFGRKDFDRVYVSYSLSMIPAWREAVEAGLGALAPGGSLHIVDFGGQEGLPRWFRALLHRWLAMFHVHPRAEMQSVLGAAAHRRGGGLEFEQIYRDYARRAVIQLPQGQE